MTNSAAQTPKAPAHLEKATRDWWLSVVTGWTLEPHHVRLLTLAAEAWDRCTAARELIGREGLTVRTQDGGCRAHPGSRSRRTVGPRFVAACANSIWTSRPRRSPPSARPRCDRLWEAKPVPLKRRVPKARQHELVLSDLDIRHTLALVAGWAPSREDRPWWQSWRWGQSWAAYLGVYHAVRDDLRAAFPDENPFAERLAAFVAAHGLDPAADADALSSAVAHGQI